MRKFKFDLDSKSLDIIYTSFIRPLLEYGSGIDVRPGKIQISLCIFTVRSESSLGAIWIASNAKFFHADSVDSNQNCLDA